MLQRRGRLTFAGTISFLALLLFFATLPTAALGQSPTDMLREFAESASGFTLVGEIETGALQADRQTTFPVEMVTGSDYMIVGFCDRDCTDMDLAILNAQGEELESDYLPDAQPVLLLTPESSGGYEIRLDMVVCTVEPCAYAVGIFQGDISQADFDIPGTDMDDRLRSFRDDLTAEGFSEIGGGEQGSLEAYQELRFPVSLQDGIEYRIVGVCDRDCENMDLVLYGPDQQEMEADRLADAFPILRIPPAEAGDYRLGVNMVTCTLEPCAFHVAVFGKGPGLAPGGVPITGEIVFESAHQGTLEEGDQQLREGEYFDEYTVRAEAGQQIIVDLRSSDFDTYLILEAPGGASERNDDFDNDTMHSHIEWVAPEEGEYAILVTSFSAEVTGDYILQIAVVEGS